MTFTRPKLDIDGANGVAACYLVDPEDVADEAPLRTPYDHLARTLWHSDFQYFEVIYDETVTLDLPARVDPRNDTEPQVTLGVPQNYSSNFAYDVEQMAFHYQDFSPFPVVTLPTSGFSFVFLLVGETWQPSLLEVDFQFTGATPTRRPRYIAPQIVGATIQVRDLWARIASTWSARTLSLRAIVVGPRVAVPSEALCHLDPVNGRVQLGRGKLDTLGRGFLREVESGGLGLTADRTIDSTPTGYKVWGLDGASEEFFSYTGSYPGPTLRRVAP